VNEHEAIAKIIEALFAWRNTHEQGGPCRNDYNEVISKLRAMHSRLVQASYPEEGSTPYLCRHQRI
jgi:hypothetical protein